MPIMTQRSSGALTASQGQLGADDPPTAPGDALTPRGDPLSPVGTPQLARGTETVSTYNLYPFMGLSLPNDASLPDIEDCHLVLVEGRGGSIYHTWRGDFPPSPRPLSIFSRERDYTRIPWLTPRLNRPELGGWVRDLTQEGVEPNPGPPQGDWASVDAPPERKRVARVSGRLWIPRVSKAQNSGRWSR